jgi:hypothetical protein
MKKIPTLFVRNSDDRRYVTRDVRPDCQWVIDGEGVATLKYDGTCMKFDGEQWWARREVKPGKPAPANFVPEQVDETTGKTVGWEPIGQSAFAKFHDEALTDTGSEMQRRGWPAGTYELVGPKVNGNPEHVDVHCLWAHVAAPVLDAPRDFDGLAKYLAGFDGEGIVWHHPDGRMAKLKRKDFPG